MEVSCRICLCGSGLLFKYCCYKPSKDLLADEKLGQILLKRLEAKRRTQDWSKPLKPLPCD